MNFLYISPEFPPNYSSFVLRLHEAGARVWGLGEADFYEMPDDLRKALIWYARTDLNSRKAVLQALDDLQNAKFAAGWPGGFDLVESHNEIWLRLEAFINETLGINGMRPSDVNRTGRMRAETSGTEPINHVLQPDCCHAVALTATAWLCVSCRNPNLKEKERKND